MKRNTKQLIPMILVFTIIAAAYSCRILAMLDIGGVWVNYELYPRGTVFAAVFPVGLFH